MKNINHTRSSISDDIRNILCSSANMRRAIPLILRLLMNYVNLSTNLASHFFDLVIGKILTSRLSLSKHLAHNLGNLLLLGKIGVFHNRRNASSRLLLLISKHLILCIYLPPSPTKSSNLSETAEVPACNVPSRSPLPALAIAPETKLGTASSGLGTLEP